MKQANSSAWSAEFRDIREALSLFVVCSARNVPPWAWHKAARPATLCAKSNAAFDASRNGTKSKPIMNVRFANLCTAPMDIESHNVCSISCRDPHRHSDSRTCTPNAPWLLPPHLRSSSLARETGASCRTQQTTRAARCHEFNIVTSGKQGHERVESRKM